jgi:hypothetical protein
VSPQKPTRFFGYRYVPERQDDVHGPPPYEVVDYDSLEAARAECGGDVLERVNIRWQDGGWEWDERNVPAGGQG